MHSLMIPRRYRGSAFPALRGVRAETRLAFAPRVNLRETDDEFVVTAELPGLEEKDFEVVLEDDVLILKGEKKSHQESEVKGWRRVETTTGSFERRFALPFEADADAVKAAYKNGVLTVTVVKPAEAKPQVAQIEVTTS